MNPTQALALAERIAALDKRQAELKRATEEWFLVSDWLVRHGYASEDILDP